MNGKQFRKIFVVEPAHDLSALIEFGEDITYVFNRYEQVDDMLSKAQSSLREFNPETDAFVPIGRVTACSVAGMVLSKMTGNKPVNFGIYKNGVYRFIKMGIYQFIKDNAKMQEAEE